MADAHLSLGAWHAGAVSTGGFFAGMLYGAKKKDALAYFERALELAPQEKNVHLEYALGLLSLDVHDNRGKARDLLERTISIPPKDAYERIIIPAQRWIQEYSCSLMTRFTNVIRVSPVALQRQLFSSLDR